MSLSQVFIYCFLGSHPNLASFPFLPLINSLRRFNPEISPLTPSTSPAACCVADNITVDKVYVVWTAGADPGRLQSRVWKFCMLGVVCYFAIFVTLFVMRQSAINSTGQCEIGLKRNASVPAAFYLW